MISVIRKYDLIVSLGEDCACATYLKMHNLRPYSLPFDWLTNASLETRFNLILDEFDKFLSVENLRIIDKKTLNHPTFDSDFDYYENIKNGLHFYHDFPYSIPIKESIKDVEDKYERRIKRLYKLLKNRKKVLFIWLSHTKNNDDIMILKKHDEISQKFNKNIDFLIIENDLSKHESDIEIINLSKNIQRIKVKTHPLNNTIKDQTLGYIENCSKIFKCLRIETTLFYKILLFRKKLSNLIKKL